MNLKEFHEKNHKRMKVFLCSKVSCANALIRQANLRDGAVSFHMLVKTPLELAKELLTAKNLTDRGSGALEFLSAEGCVYLMLQVLKEQKSALFSESTLTIGTARETLLCVNEIRENGVTEDYRKEAVCDQKIKELDRVVSAYEAVLSEKGIYDKCRILREAAEVCRNGAKKVTGYLPCLSGAVFGEFSTDRWTVAEQVFIESLLLAVCSEKETIEYLQEESRSGLSFFKARGMANEVRFAAAKIKEIAKKESCGTISLYYSSPEYINFIKAVLDAERIPYCITDGRPVSELSMTQFFLSLLDAAEQDFSFELLEKAVRNRVITFDNVLKRKKEDINKDIPEMDEPEEENGENEDLLEMSEAEMEEKVSGLSEEDDVCMDSVRVNPIRGYRRARSAGIGWGRERYLTYYENVVRDDKAEENTKVFARFLYDFVSVFDEKFSFGALFQKLWAFVRTYTYASNPEKKILNHVLQEKGNELRFIDSTGYSLKEKIAFLRDMLENLKVEEGTGKSDAVCIYPMRDLFVMERKHNFMLGLSAASFSVDDKQSPLLLDEEKRKFLQGADVPGTPVRLAVESNRRLAENVKMSLCTRRADADVRISYSYYDSINLRESSPSVLFIELSEGKEISCVPGYEDASYIVNKYEDFRVSAEELEEAIKDRAKEIEKEREEKRKRRAEKKGGTGDEEQQTEENQTKVFRMSASGIQTLLRCPLMYYYQYTRFLRIDDHMMPKGHEWLDARNKGNLCHFTMEKYMKEAQDPAGQPEQELFDRVYEEALSEIEVQQPAFSDEVKNREKKFYKKKLQSYLSFLCDRWKDEKADGKEWKVIGCELSFGALDETGSLQPVYHGLINEKEYEIYLNGSIDRVDGYIDADGKLMLRIIDYKTGSKKNKEKEIQDGLQIQHYIYAMALKEYMESDAGKKRCMELFGREYEDYDFEWVGYTFPYEENDDDRFLNVLDLFSEESAVVFPEEISRQLDCIIGNMLTGGEDRLSGEMEVLIRKKREERKEEKDEMPGAEIPLEAFCSGNYCKYQTICRKWVGYAEQAERL